MPALLRRLAVLVYECISSPSFFMATVYSALVRHRFKRCGSGLHLRVSSTIVGHRNIVIGRDLVSMGHLYLYANEGGAIDIGDHCSFNTNVQIGAAGSRIRIGNHVMIASNVVLRAANHGMKRGIPMRQQPSVAEEITVEDDVWIGSNAVVTGGVILAEGTVVAAGAVVTRSTGPYSIVGGVPARKIGERS